MQMRQVIISIYLLVHFKLIYLKYKRSFNGLFFVLIKQVGNFYYEQLLTKLMTLFAYCACILGISAILKPELYTFFHV